jgi:hypothetical protein
MTSCTNGLRCKNKNLDFDICQEINIFYCQALWTWLDGILLRKNHIADSFTDIQSNIQGLEACRIFPNKNA